MENEGPRSREVEKHGLWWKARGVGNRDSGGKHGVWTSRGLVKNTGCGKHGVWWKTRGLFLQNVRFDLGISSKLNYSN